MKAIWLIIVVAAACATGASAADDKAPKKTHQKPDQPSVIQTKDKVLTGSYLKTQYRRNGMVTDGPNNVLVIDRKTIDQSGAADLRQLLYRTGLRR
jgi:outer membrane receptor for monomeric catechols